jgi:dolichyl-phosphate-mannose--protein O-mannosyl transferase
MKINQVSFEKLSPSSKSSYLWTHGELIFTRMHSGSFVKLYSLFDFFAEVYYDTLSLQIEKIVALDRKTKVDVYERFLQLNLPLAV